MLETETPPAAAETAAPTSEPEPAAEPDAPVAEGEFCVDSWHKQIS